VNVPPGPPLLAVWVGPETIAGAGWGVTVAFIEGLAISLRRRVEVLFGVVVAVGFVVRRIAAEIDGVEHHAQ